MSALRKPTERPIVVQIQHALLDPARSLTEILPMADMVARKLGLDDAQEWIASELNGYTGEVPEYRRAQGRLYALDILGWRPVQATPEAMASVVRMTMVPIGSPIGTLEAEARSGDKGEMSFAYPPEMQNLWVNRLGAFDVAIRVSAEMRERIVRAVRERLTSWTIELEKQGILGEGLEFSIEDKEKAQQVMTHYNIANANIGVAGNVTATEGSRVEVSRVGDRVDVGRAATVATQILQQADMLPGDLLLASLRSPATALRDETAKTQPNRARIDELLTTIRSVCENAAGGLIAGGILAALAALAM